MITLRQIEAFKAVLDAGTVVRGAEAMRRSQPAVSRLLSDLEAAIGFRLFDRRKGKLTPRREARDLYAEVDRCLVGLQQIAEAADYIGRRKRTRLRVATLPIFTIGPLARVATRFLDERPEVFLSLESRTRPQILEGLARNLHDVALATLPVDDPKIDATPILASVESVCLVPANHPLSARDIITPQDLDGERCIFGADRTPMRQKIGQILSDAGSRPDIRVEVTTAHAVIALVAQGFGIGMAWNVMQDVVADHGIHMIPFRPQLQVNVAALFPADQPLEGIAADFVDAFGKEATAWQSRAR